MSHVVEKKDMVSVVYDYVTTGYVYLSIGDFSKQVVLLSSKEDPVNSE